MKNIKIALTLATLMASGQALEFGTMGSQAFGMGGVGVAIKHSPWGLYYNPALMAADSGFKVGLHVGFQSKSDNFFNLFNIKKNDSADLIQSKLEELTKNSSIKLTNQDGAVIQLPDFGIGVLATGAFITASASGSARLDLPSQPSNNNLKDAKLLTDYSVFTLLEVPVGYAIEFDTSAGDFSLGVTAKYMNLSGVSDHFAIQQGTNVMDAFKNMMKFDIGGGDSNFGLDLGFSYEIADCFTMGIVGKYLNSPTFKTKNGSFTIAPQARAGVALDFDWFMLGLDVDATANKDLANQNFKTQMIGLGTAFDFEWVAIRGGIATDLQHTNDMIFSLGLGITFLDIGVQFGKKTSPLNGIQMPDYFALQVGAGFSF